jgi:DNA-binding transcriptional regulator YbjK
VTDRVNALTDAAIRLVASRGMRGLTHRAVDTEAGVPPGSTSAYFRTRKALVEGVVRRLSDLDLADSAPLVAQASPTSLDQLAEAIATVLDHWMTTGRDRTLARYACLLEATHHPELRGILAHGARPRAQARDLLERLGVPDPTERSHTLVAFLDGLLFDRLVGAGATTTPPPGTPAARTSLTKAVHQALTTALTP